MTEVIFVSTKRNSSIGYLQQGTSVPYEKPYFNALVEKVLGKKSSEHISREIESYSNKKRFVIVLRDEQLKTFLKAKALIATCKDKRIKDEKGYVTINEPACGSGSMILGLATLMLELGYNPQEQLLIKATDIDKRCVNMCFTQLGYYGLSAIVIHGDTLSNKEWEKQYTPIYLLNKWYFKKGVN